MSPDQVWLMCKEPSRRLIRPPLVWLTNSSSFFHTYLPSEGDEERKRTLSQSSWHRGSAGNSAGSLGWYPGYKRRINCTAPRIVLWINFKACGLTLWINITIKQSVEPWALMLRREKEAARLVCHHSPHCHAWVVGGAALQNGRGPLNDTSVHGRAGYGRATLEQTQHS